MRSIVVVVVVVVVVFGCGCWPLPKFSESHAAACDLQIYKSANLQSNLNVDRS